MIFVIAVNGFLPFSSIKYTKLAKKNYTYAKYPAVAPKYLWAAGKHSSHVDVSHEKQEGEPTEEHCRRVGGCPCLCYQECGSHRGDLSEKVSLSHCNFLFVLFLNWIRSLNPDPEQTEVTQCWQKLILLILVLVFTWTVPALGGYPSWELWTIFAFLINHHWSYSVKRKLGWKMWQRAGVGKPLKINKAFSMLPLALLRAEVQHYQVGWEFLTPLPLTCNQLLLAVYISAQQLKRVSSTECFKFWTEYFTWLHCEIFIHPYNSYMLWPYKVVYDFCHLEHSLVVCAIF